MLDSPKHGDLVKWWGDVDEDYYIKGAIDVVGAVIKVENLGGVDYDVHTCRIIDTHGVVRERRSDLMVSDIRYINVYHVSRSYGGPEEGGWWYDEGDPIASVPFTNALEGDRIREQLTAKFKDPIEYAKKMGWRRGRFSVIGDTDVEIYNEDHFAKAFPEVTPHYE